MKKVAKKFGIGVGVLCAALIVFLIGLIIFHKINLGLEQDQLTPPGHMVDVNGELMHIYLAGENEEALLLVFLPSHGRFAPVYNFRPLYSLLTDYFRIAVVEPFGYGYSDFTDVPRDIDTIVSEIRAALFYLGETGSFVLLPNSIGGLYALRWAQLYPEEVAGIISIDMAHPAMFLNGHVGNGLPSVLSWLGVQRFPFFNALFYPYPIDEHSLTQDEHNQQRLLINRNLANRTVMAELATSIPNAQVISDEGLPNVPTLLLVSTVFRAADGFWVPYKEELSRQLSAQIELFDRPHALHQYEPERIANLVRQFIAELQE